MVESEKDVASFLAMLMAFCWSGLQAIPEDQVQKLGLTVSDRFESKFW